MHDVQRAAGVGGQRDRAGDRLDLRDHGPGGEVVTDARAARRDRLAGQGCRERVVLGMHEHRQAKGRRGLHAPPERGIVGRLKVVDAAAAHEGLEADHTPGGELGQPIDIARHEAAPEGEVGPCGAAGRGDLGIERRRVERGRGGVQGHVHEQRAAPRCERGGPGRKPLPVAAAGIVEVHVRIDDPGQDVAAGGVDRLRGVAGELGSHLRDPAVGDRHVGMPQPVDGHDRSATKDEVPPHPQLPR